ncbi:MAG TPA: VWA domain-containing protein, partial [Burkholderiales bacterium]|nr:VWA domain-containing protein [Burkholderiales bacterium]
ASLRAGLRGGADLIPLVRRAPCLRRPPLVALADVSGSMSRYTRIFLHLLHAIADGSQRVHAFTFGTRLTPITRELRERDPDAALARVARAVKDWSGGTRIGACLKEFNLRWSRRLLGQGAVVLLITDGLECEGGADLAREMERLHKSCRALIWLNPLLRYPRFEARAHGIRAMLPHVDAFLPAHNLESLERLAAALADESRWPNHERAAEWK